MDYQEKITPGATMRLEQGAEDRPYIIFKNRMVFAKKCKYCQEEFFPRRKNHYYCSDSCRVMRCRDAKKKRQSANKNSLQHLKSMSSTPKIKLQSIGESALGTAAVSGLKYMMHDQHVMKKLDQILNQLEGNVSSKVPVSSAPLRFLGMSNTGSALLSLFQHPKTGKLYACDAHNRWMQQVSHQPEKWEWL